MNNLNNYISEKLKISSQTKINNYKYKPQTTEELRKILEERLDKDKNADLNDIDVSKIDDLSSLFRGLDPHNIKINKWDVSNVKWMNATFMGCKNFNSDISSWDVSNVEYMNYTFHNCQKFDCDLSKWNVEKVKRWNGIFAPYNKDHKYKEEYKPKFKLK